MEILGLRPQEGVLPPSPRITLSLYSVRRDKMNDDLDLNSLPSFVELGVALDKLTNYQYFREGTHLQKKIKDVVELYIIMKNEFPKVLQDLEKIKQELKEHIEDEIL
jgi:hypothetical protein